MFGDGSQLLPKSKISWSVAVAMTRMVPFRYTKSLVLSSSMLPSNPTMVTESLGRFNWKLGIPTVSLYDTARASPAPRTTVTVVSVSLTTSILSAEE